jgi:hypothetical protein
MTLVETMCSATVLAVAIAALSNLSASAGALHLTGTQKAAALRTVERQLAQIAATPFDDMQATWDGASFGVTLEGKAAEALRAFANDADGQPGAIAVTAPTGLPSELLEIQVRADWISPNGPQSLARRLRVSRVGSAP